MARQTVLSDSVYRKIKTMLLRGQIRCGERIEQKHVGRLLGVSRTPVREAIERLSHEGIVTASCNRSARVIAFDRAAVRDLGAMRVGMDCLLIRLAALAGGDRQRRQFGNFAETMRTAGDIVERLLQDAMFYAKLAEAADNGLIADIHGALTFRTHLYCTTIPGATDLPVFARMYYLTIARALMEGNADEAGRIVAHASASLYGTSFATDADLSLVKPPA